MKIRTTIKTIFGEILWESEKETVREAVIEKYEKDANLRYADLLGADLLGADLLGADLRGADLRGAKLRGAKLRGAKLRGADLYGADLRGANLLGADLLGADLLGADLRGAKLRGADLRGAKLRGADLAKLPTDYINQCSRDILFILHCLPSEVPHLKEKLIKGEIDGSQYDGECCCLVGTLSNGKGVEEVCQTIPFYEKGTHNYGEMFFFNIRKGDTPKNNQFSAHVLKLIEMQEKGEYYTITY